MTPATYWNVVPFRDPSVDLLRGLAIAIMVGANLIPFLLVPPAPFWLRVVVSVAAPLFIFLSGMMVALSFCKKKHTLSYFLIRGGFVVLLAALLDLLTREAVPFLDIDVLYLIGISLPVSLLFLSLDLHKRILVFLSIIAVTPLAQAFFGYSGLPLQVPVIPVLSGSALPTASAVLRQWLIEGWFPVFPWLAIALIGAHTGTFRWRDGRIRSFLEPPLVLVSFVVCTAGALFWFLFQEPAVTPYGYVELFYPPTVVFVLCMTSLIFCLFIAADWLMTSRKPFETIQVLGQCSLAIYLLHTMIIELFIRPLAIKVPLPLYSTACLAFIAGMLAFALMVRHIRLRLAHPPFVIRVLIGG